MGDGGWCGMVWVMVVECGWWCGEWWWSVDGGGAWMVVGAMVEQTFK